MCSCGGPSAVCVARVRRLYDIANVFTSLELIEKIHLTQTRKPAFKWLGSRVYPLASSVPREAYTCDAPSRKPEVESIEFLREVGAELDVVDIEASEPADIGELTSDAPDDACEEVEMARLRTRDPS
jgi:hypothetical protein